MSPNDERILVLAPTGQDAPLICEQLGAAGLSGLVCASLKELINAVLEGAAAALIAEEALDENGVDRLLEVLHSQPAWSDLPIVVLSGTELHENPAGDELLRKLAEIANVTLIERPSRIVTLIMTVQAALRARRRQYEFREYLREYERYQEQVRHTQKLESLGVLAGGIAHDFNNLLTGILGNVSLVADMLSEVHPGRQHLSDAIAASERAAKLTGQMLAYSGKGQFLIRTVDLSGVVRRLDDFFRAPIPKRVELELNLTEVPAIQADESQIEQVIMNLVLNAAEAIPQGRSGHVKVTTGVQPVVGRSVYAGADGSPLRPGTYTYLEVADDGIGMDDATRAKIFDPFFTTKFIGRGLGLAAVQGVVRGHRGGLRVESHQGRGTIFTILFPEYRAYAPAYSESESALRRDRRATILVVDDEEMVRRVARSVLEQHGFTVVSAENGKIAAEMIQRGSDEIDLVLLDMTMPVMDGEAALRVLKAVKSSIKVILSSGYDEAEALRRFTGRGLAGFIQKPYTNKRLIESIHRALDDRDTANAV